MSGLLLLCDFHIYQHNQIYHYSYVSLEKRSCQLFNFY